MNEDQNNNAQGGREEESSVPEKAHNEGQELKEQEQECPNCKVVMKRIADCEKQRDEYLNGWQRAKADFINYKKEESNRLESVIRLGNEELIRDMVNVLDSFELGMVAMKGNESAEKGFQMIRSQCEEVLRRYGLEKVSAKEGETFDPSRHEAVEEIVTSFPPNTVTEVVSAGYTLNGRMIRPAKVKISKGPENNQQQTTNN